MRNVRRREALGMAAAASAALLWGCSSAPTSEGSDADSTSAATTMRVASWNVDSKAHPDINKMSEILLELGIEVMGFQEIDVNNTRNDYDMAEAFRNENYPYVHFAKGRDFANGGFGIGTVSSHELLEVSSVPTESTSSKATKTLERTVFEKDGKRVAFYVAHTSWENTALRRRQMAQIIERVRQDDAPYIIMVADWNADQSLYEYASFMEDFNIANGKDGQWLDTFNGEDETMKVMTVDNIITSKNIEIAQVDTFHSDMADHDMIYADLVFSDEPASFSSDPNRALGAGVVASSTATDSDPLMATDSFDETAWKSAGGEAEPTLVVELPYVVSARSVEIVWDSASRPETFGVSLSLDGIEFESAADGLVLADPSEVAISGECRFVRVDMRADGESAVGIGEVKVYGEVVRRESQDEGSLVENGGFEAGDASWEFAIDGEPDSEVEDQQACELTWSIDTSAHEGAACARIERSGSEGYGEGLLSQKIEGVLPNASYLLSFWQMTDTLGSDAFGWEIVQRNAAGEELDLYHVVLTDNLNLAHEWRRNDYTFTTAPDVASIEVIFRVCVGEGSLWLDDVVVRQDVPVEVVRVGEGPVELGAGEQAGLVMTAWPENYDDLTFEWVSQDESVAEVDESGTVSAVASGEAFVGVRSMSDLVAESYVLVKVG